MKQITEEQINEYADQYSDTLEFNICGYDYIDTENAFKAGMKKAIELMQPEWTPIAEYSREKIKGIKHDRIMILFENGLIGRYSEPYPMHNATHIHILPEPPKTD